MNHVPDETLAAIDRFGEGLLLGSATPVQERLRSDLQLEIPRTVANIEAGWTVARFRVAHTRTEPTLCGYGSFVETESTASSCRGASSPQTGTSTPGTIMGETPTNDDSNCREWPGELTAFGSLR